MLKSLQTRLKRAGRWLPVALLPLAAHAQALNYLPANATVAAGTYTDLASTGTVIATANTDDANSGAQPIGFSFNYNGAAFTQFVLNTNGFLVLGATPPSATTLFLSESNANNVDPFQSPAPADINIIAPFNVDLTAGNGAGGAEYRVATTGTAPNQVCTIQWKNISDKAETVATQYANWSFQVKLYQTSGNIEFVYDAPTVSPSPGALRFSQVGLKGSGFNDGQFVQASKPSTGAWSATTFSGAIVNNFLNTVNFRNTVNPVAGTTYRFAPAVLLSNDAEVTAVYTLGKVSSAYGSPVTAQALVKNTGSTAQTNLAVTLTVTGSTSYVNSQTIASLASGASALVNFSYPVSGNTGTNTLAVTIPADGLATNNSKTLTQSISSLSQSHFPDGPVTFTGGIGSGTANTLLLARYRVNSAAPIASVTPVFAGTGTATSTYQVVIYSASGASNTPGALLYTSPTRTRPATAAADPVAISPGISVNGDFFVGIKQLTASNIGLSFLTDLPLRPATFYFSSDGVAFGDFNTSALAPRLAIDVAFGVVTSTRNEALAATVGLYPNPATQRFTLALPAGSLHSASATLVNALGQVVLARQLALPASGGTADFDVSRLPTGVYSLRLQAGADFVVKRLVIE